MKRPMQPVQFWFTSTLIAMCIWLTSPGIKAYVKQSAMPSQASQAFPFAEYEAKYSIKFHGVKAGESVHRLHKREAGLYHFESKTLPIFEMLPYQYYESTEFVWENNQIKPQNYFYDIQEGKRTKKGNVAFDWENNKLANTVSKEPWEDTIVENIQDKLTQSLRLRYDLIKNNTNLKYQVAEDDEVKPYHFRILGEEQITTPIGTYMTVKVEHIHRKGHRTHTWFAKELEYLPIKVTHIRKGRVVGQGEIISFHAKQKQQS